MTAELFLEVYAAFENGELPSVKNVEDMLRSYVNDYCQDMMEQRIAEAVDPQLDFAVRIVMDSDLSDLRYLYRYGEYVSANETGVAEFMNSLSQDEIDSMARTYTEGYRIGFINGRKDITRKKTVNIRYNLGFERMVRAAILQFREMGLEPVIYRHATHAVNKRGNAWIGFVGGNANPQYEYDHRQDQALFMDSDYVQRKLRSMQNAYEKYKDLAAVHGGPACIETFGEEPFAPVSTEGAWALNEAQQKMQVELDNESGQIVNRYIRGDERSFTIIAYPVPEIGNDFPKIFAEIVKINTLDYKQYERIQQTIIETLDTCQWVEIKGKEDNETDLIIHLHELEDVRKQTNFENCVADVNIPVGEVFTSPVLAGTGGILHVKKVYLNGLQFKDLKLVFDCGQVIDYSCANFETEEENRAYIEDNILHHHPKIPMGEFAIGTNTTAYVAAEKYGIAEFIPWILSQCASVAEVRTLLSHMNLVNTPFSEQFPLAQLHWIISDETASITVESIADGLHIYDNPVGVLTNNPPFPQQMFQLNNYMHLSSKQPVNTFADDLTLTAYSRGMGALGLPGDLSSASRFARVAFTKMNSISGDSEAESISQFFHILGSVDQQRGCCEVTEGKYEITLYTSCCNATKGISNGSHLIIIYAV